MTSDSAAGASRDWTEREARFVIEPDKFNVVMSELGDLRLGPYSLQSPDVEEHDDTYFDTRDHDLYELGCSLRIRTRDIGTRITLKIPEPGEDGDGAGSRNREIENSDYSDIIDVFLEIIRLLREKRVIRRDWDSAAIMHLLIAHGAAYALGSAGLQDLFTVTTERHTWRVMDTGQEISELTLDDSRYQFKRVIRDNYEHQCRMEVELRASAPDELLRELIGHVRGRFGFDEEHSSKFEYGMTLYLGRKLAEKVEVKIIMPVRSAHGEIVKKIKRDAGFVPGYIFSRDGEHRLKDVYFDNNRQGLFMAGHYLRLRADGNERDLKFRILEINEQLRDAIQYEVSAKSSDDDFEDSWDKIQGWLVATAHMKKSKKKPSSLDRIGKTLEGMGFKPALEVDISRVSWSVWKGGDQRNPRSTRGELIARLKYDEITFRRPGEKRGEQDVEFEVAGVEDHEGAPRILRRDYYAFLYAFTAQCRESADMKNIGWQVNAKYFEGLVKLGLHYELPNWWGSLRTIRSFRRDPPYGSPARDEAEDDDSESGTREGAASGDAARTQAANAARDIYAAGRDVSIHNHFPDDN